MAATVVINEWNDDGSSPTGVKTDKTSGTVRFKNADDALVNTNNPLVVPDAGSPSVFEYSFQKWLKLEITGGSFTQVENIQAYMDGANGFGTGVSLYGAIGTQFVAPVVPSESASPPQFGGVSMVDMFTYTSGSRLDMDAGDPGPHTANGDIGDYLVMVMAVEATASAGTTPSETLTITYDEI